MPRPVHAGAPPRPRLLALVAMVLLATASWARQPPAQSPSQPPNQPAPADEPRPPSELDAFEGRPIARVTLRRAGDEGAAEPLGEALEGLVRTTIRTRVGAPYERAVASEDVDRLYKLGRFKTVDTTVALVDGRYAGVTFSFALQPIVNDVQCVGNKLLTDAEVTGGARDLIGTPVDLSRIERFARGIEDRYRAKAYYNAAVSVDARALDEAGVVIFKVREGHRTRVRDIRFRGNLSFTTRELSKDLKTEAAWALETGPLDNEALAQDRAMLLQFYKDRGYLDAQTDAHADLSPDAREAIVTFEIDEGPLYTFRSLIAEHEEGDERVLSPEQLQGLMLLKPGDVFGEAKLAQSVDAIRDAYISMGYVDAEVARSLRRDTDRPLVDVVLSIAEKRRYRTGRHIVRGNTQTQSGVVLRHVAVQPERWLDATKIRDSRRRLAGSQLFAENSVRLTIQPEFELDPGYRDVLVEVEETNTGEFLIGGAVDSDGGVTAQVAINQRNFDILDTPDTFAELFTGDAFRGAGQRFSLQIQPGDQQQTFSVSLAEPSLFDSDLGATGSAFFRRRVYRPYDEIRYGGGFTLSRAFGSRWVGSVPLRALTVHASNFDADAPTDYFAADDPKFLASAGVTLRRTTFDRPLQPSRGNGIEFGVDQVFGDYTYNILRADYSLFLPISEDIIGRRTVVSIKTSANYVPQDFDEVPFFERFYLGGRTFRGFDYRGIAPRGIRNDNGLPSSDPVGGNFSYFLGVEVQRPLYEDLIAGVLFLDTGTVNKEFSFADYRAAVGVGIRLKLPISPAPLALDFGFPIAKDDADETQVFSFSVDIPFK